ncbi:MAG: hypothetical protein NTX19_11795 [Gemmatimonadetes bacterium]|nr:hypothetical protein [Gemmatimonadota bacterium]
MTTPTEGHRPSGSRNFAEDVTRLEVHVADLTAKALRNAHRFESLVKTGADQTLQQRTSDLQRVALERLVGVALNVIAEEAKG